MVEMTRPGDERLFENRGGTPSFSNRKNFITPPSTAATRQGIVVGLSEVPLWEATDTAARTLRSFML
jgi:hypothetical protein